MKDKQIDKKHISLALQGGGVKGVEYVGAYKAILDEFQGMEITTIIGSSAGGIIGLAICCEMKPEDIIDDIGVKYLSKMIEDLTFPNGDEAVELFCRDRFRTMMCSEKESEFLSRINEEQLNVLKEVSVEEKYRNIRKKYSL